MSGCVTGKTFQKCVVNFLLTSLTIYFKENITLKHFNILFLFNILAYIHFHTLLREPF